MVGQSPILPGGGVGQKDKSSKYCSSKFLKDYEETKMEEPSKSVPD